ncbi:MAG: hypothetical protein HUU20_19800 [Pirellulales bacterium]|nr:hypothetical protein [Pirellulales bacterium]
MLRSALLRNVPAALAALALSASSVSAGSVRLTVKEPSGIERQQWPVTSGIPLAQGAVNDPQSVALAAEDGGRVPLQTHVLARWPDGSIRWLLVDFQLDLQPSQSRAFTLEYGAGIQREAVSQPIRTQSLPDGLEINTGPMRLVLASARFRPLDAVWLDANSDGTFSDAERITGSEEAGIILTAPDGKPFRADLAAAKIELEEAGPLRACARIEGDHAAADGKMFHYVVRLHAFRGQPLVKMFYTFVNDRCEPEMSPIDSLSLVFAAADKPAGEGLLDGKIGSGGRLFQIDEKRYEIDGKPAGQRAAGWAADCGTQGGFAVGVRHFWQNWPKGIDAEPGKIRVHLCPPFEKGLYDGRELTEEVKLYYYLRDGVYRFKLGVARTHELWAAFFTGRPDPRKLAATFRAAEDPLLAVCDPAVACATKAFGDIAPAGPVRGAAYDAWFDAAFHANLTSRDNDRFYGMLNFGDWWGERGVNWGNLEYDLGYCLFLQYLRTGRRDIFERAEQAARHHIDVDVIHAENPKDPKGPRAGEIWAHSVGHTGGYYHDAPLPASNTYQKGWNQNQGHVWIVGDFLYYYLTGDRRAWDVALLASDTMARQCPTAYGDHIRAIGWPMVLVLAAYEATGDKKYLDAATKNWEVLKKHIDWQRGWVVRLAKGHCKHTDQDCYGNVPFMEGLTCSALARYHRHTGDPEVLRAIGVGIDQMIRECWVEDQKAFRYSACPISPLTPALLPLSAEAMAYEVRQTGNKEHLRVLQEGLSSSLKNVAPASGGSTMGIITHFTPFALEWLEKN